jgi:hypothetical protein
MSELRHRQEGSDADRCLPVFLRVQELWNSAQAQAGRLLRFLFLRRRAVPSYSGGTREREGNRLLRDVINRTDVTDRPSPDWAGNIRAYGWLWGLPLIAIGASLFIDVRVRTVIWTAALIVMGRVCVECSALRAHALSVHGSVLPCHDPTGSHARFRRVRRWLFCMGRACRADCRGKQDHLVGNRTSMGQVFLIMAR